MMRGKEQSDKMAEGGLAADCLRSVVRDAPGGERSRVAVTLLALTPRTRDGDGRRDDPQELLRGRGLAPPTCPP